MTEKQKHVHKFKRLRYKSGNEVFFCTLPDCSAKLNPALALGKKSLCWRCGNEFIMNEYALRLSKPHCEACHKNKKDLVKLSELDTTREILYEAPLTLAERLQQTINQAKPDEDEI
jgi:hypothetical protein